MSYGTFAFYNVTGALLWVASCFGLGYLFGNVPIVKRELLGRRASSSSSSPCCRSSGSSSRPDGPSVSSDSLIRLSASDSRSDGHAHRDRHRPLLPRWRLPHRSRGAPVERALITHAHGDHARRRQPAPTCAPSLRAAARSAGSGRTSGSRRCRTANAITLGDVRVSFHPAGHVLGSAQIRIEGAERRVGRGRRLQARRRSDVRAVRAGAVRHVRHRVHLRPADLPLGSAAEPSIADILDWWDENREPRTHLGALLLHASARRSGCSPSSRASPTGRSSSTA